MDIERITTNAGFMVFTQHRADYHGRDFTATKIQNILDRAYEVYDEGETLPRQVTTIQVKVDDVPTSDIGDTIERDGKTWHVNEVLEDDGYERRIEVY